jgi:hypothetical protein
MSVPRFMESGQFGVIDNWSLQYTGAPIKYVCISSLTSIGLSLFLCYF